MQVPFLDLKAQYEAIKPEIHSALQAVIDKTAFAGGPFVEKFEKDFAPFCGCPEAVGVGSGTEALWMALLALGVGPGDEVITVPNTFIATAEAISFCGATPVFVDVDERTATLDPVKLEELLREKMEEGRGKQEERRERKREDGRWKRTTFFYAPRSYAPHSSPSNGSPEGDHPRPPLRPDGRYGPHPGAGGEIRLGGRGGCLPGPWGGV